MSTFQFAVLLGMQMTNLLILLTVQRMLHNHHQQAAEHVGGERGADGAGGRRSK